MHKSYKLNDEEINEVMNLPDISSSNSSEEEIYQDLSNINDRESESINN